MQVALCFLALCGVALAAPQHDVRFDFEKNVGVRSDGNSDGGQVRVVNIPRSQPTQTFAQVHKNHRQNAQDFLNSESGQALDNAGAEFFSSLGNFLSRLFNGGTRTTVGVQHQHQSSLPVHSSRRNDGENLVFVQKTKTIN